MNRVTGKLVGKEPSFLSAIEAAENAAARDVPVLVYGETGSGKGRVAELIHRASNRRGRFVSLNCATFQANLFESELFGYMKGAFTGADKDTPGLFETAAGGTLFLDEIGDTPLEIQPKLLRALEEGVVRRVGGRSEIEVKVRLVCATNRDLSELIKEGKFRADLYYRINSFVVEVPPLRKRRSDIPDLAEHFLREIVGDGPGPKRLSKAARDAMLAYSWPGNVRELRSALAFACANCGEREVLEPGDLPEAVQRGQEPAGVAGKSHMDLFNELYLRGATDRVLWAKFLLALNRHLGTNKFARGDMLECIRHARGSEPTNNALVNEWQRHIKPVPLRLGLISEEGKKLRMNLAACNALLQDTSAEVQVPVPDAPPPLVALPAVHRRTNLASSRTTFIGRSRELAELTDMMKQGAANLISITGPGGTGKTRLSQEIVRRMADELAGGAWFADLTESRNIEGVAYAVANALGLPLTTNQPPELLVGSMLESRPPTLLVLDNFEQVVEVAAPVLGEWARRAPSVRFVVTTRALLGLEGEREFELSPLGLPDPAAAPEDIAASDAVRLFAERARLQHISFALTTENAGAVAALCKRLEGMPLAIELAAARTVIMQPEQILGRLEKSFALLKSTRRDLAPRQRSLEATIDWSFDLLSEAEQVAFAQLSIFRGGFFLGAAERVLDLSGLPSAPEPIDVIQSLREKSLLRAQETPYETRFAMYIAIREYAAARWQQLSSPEQREALDARHSRWLREYAMRWDARAYTRDAVEAFDRLDFERSNLKAAMARSRARATPSSHRLFRELAKVSSTLLKTRGPAKLRAPVLRDALAMAEPGDSAERAGLLLLLAQAESEAGDPAAVDDLIRQGSDMAQRLGDQRLIALAKFRHAGQLLGARKLEESLAEHAAAISAFEAVGDRNNAARTRGRMALALVNLGRFDEAQKLARESERDLRELGDLAGVASAISNRGTVHFHATQHEPALAAYREAYDIYTKLADKRLAMLMQGNIALIARQQRRLDDAVAMMEETGRMAAEQGDLPSLAINHMNLGLAYLDLARYDAAAAAFTKGRDLFERLERRGHKAVCIENLAIIAARNGDMKAANQLLAEALSLVDQGENTLWAGVQVTRSELLLQQGDAKQALEAARQSRATLEEAGLRRSRDYYRAITAHACALSELKHKDAAEVAKTALLTAELLGYTAADPSPKVREDLQTLAGIAG